MPTDIAREQYSVEDSFGTDRSFRLALAGIVLLAVVLRLFGVLTHPVDQDELYTVMESTDLFATTLDPGIQSRPLYYLVQHALFWILPNHEPWTRLLPLLAGTAGVWLVGRLTYRIAGANAALVAALVLACSPWHIYASETARYYSIIAAAITAAAWLIIEARIAGTTRSWALASVPVVIGTLVHPAFVLASACMIAFAIFRGPMRTPRWQWPSRATWQGFVAPVVVGATLLLTSVLAFHRAGGVGNGGVRSIGANLRLLPAIIEWSSPVVVLAGFCGLALTAIASRSGPPSERDDTRLIVENQTIRMEAAMMLGINAASTMLLVVCAAFVTATYADYAIGALPALCIGVGLLAGWITATRRALVIGGLAVAALIPSLASHLSDGTRFDYRPAFEEIRRSAPGRLVLVWPAVTALHYISDLRRAELAQSPSQLDSLLAHETRAWAVVSVKRYGLATEGGRALHDWLQQHCVERDAFERARFDVRMYRVSLQECR